LFGIPRIDEMSIWYSKRLSSSTNFPGALGCSLLRYVVYGWMGDPLPFFLDSFGCLLFQLQHEERLKNSPLPPVSLHTSSLAAHFNAFLKRFHASDGGVIRMVILTFLLLACMPVTAVIDGAFCTIALAVMWKRSIKEGGISVTKDASAVSSATPTRKKVE
jgi:hypothetical protein